MDASLAKILEWVSANAREVLSHLNGPASDADIASVEAATGLTLPVAYKDFLRRHNGEDGATWLALLGNGNQLLSCQCIIDQYRLEQEIGRDLYHPELETPTFWKDRAEEGVIFIKGPVKPLTLHPGWLPITCMNGDVLRYLDYDPAPGGIPGQVIEVDPEGCTYQVLATSFEALLNDYASQLATGKYRVAEDGFIESVHADDLNWVVPDWLKQV